MFVHRPISNRARTSYIELSAVHSDNPFDFKFFDRDNTPIIGRRESQTLPLQSKNSEKMAIEATRARISQMDSHEFVNHEYDGGERGGKISKKYRKHNEPSLCSRLFNGFLALFMVILVLAFVVWVGTFIGFMFDLRPATGLYDLFCLFVNAPRCQTSSLGMA